MARIKRAPAKAPAPEPRTVRGPARAKPTAKCVVCGESVAPFSTEELCWVCRRLKISAWRENDNQIGPE